MTIEDQLENVLENSNCALDLRVRQGGTAGLQQVASATFMESSRHLSNLEEAEANLEAVKADAARFLATDEAGAASHGEFWLANFVEQRRIEQRDAEELAQ